MKRIAIALLLPGVLAACGSAPAGSPDQTSSTLSIGVSVDDSASNVTVTKNVDSTTKAVTWVASTPGAVSFTFTSRPGSNAAYITSYKVVRDSFNGTSTGASDVIQKINVYVPSGYTCTGVSNAPSQTQSCPFNGSTTTPANGVTSSATGIDFSSALIPVVIATSADASRDLDIDFYGVSSNGAAVVIHATHIVAIGTKLGAP